MSNDEQKDPVGSVAEEATKLFRALQDWAKESGTDYANAAAHMASGAAGALRDIDEHIATGGEDCRYCPVCQAVSMVRNTSPEVRHHLSNAASSLMQAAAGLLATYPPDPADGPGPRSPVEKIDLDADDWEDD